MSERHMPDVRVAAEEPKLGDRVRDRVTGFEGIVTGTTRYLTGCNQVMCENAEHVGVDAFRWIDSQRCEVLGHECDPEDFLPDIPEDHDSHPTRSQGRPG